MNCSAEEDKGKVGCVQVRGGGGRRVSRDLGAAKPFQFRRERHGRWEGGGTVLEIQNC